MFLAQELESYPLDGAQTPYIINGQTKRTKNVIMLAIFLGEINIPYTGFFSAHDCKNSKHNI